MNLVARASRRRVGRASRPAIELAARRRPHSQPGTAALPLRRFRGSMREIQSRGILAEGHPRSPKCRLLFWQGGAAAPPGWRTSSSALPFFSRRQQGLPGRDCLFLTTQLYRYFDVLKKSDLKTAIIDGFCSKVSDEPSKVRDGPSKVNDRHSKVDD